MQQCTRPLFFVRLPKPFRLAPRPGFEPGLKDSKSSVLPLDDLGTEPNFKDIFLAVLPLSREISPRSRREFL